MEVNEDQERRNWPKLLTQSPKKLEKFKRVFAGTSKSAEYTGTTEDKEFKNPKKTRRIRKQSASQPEVTTTNNYDTSFTDNLVPVKSITPLKSKSISYLCLVTVPKTQQLNAIKKFNEISNVKFNWERFLHRQDYTQCFNCQVLGHWQNNNCFNKTKYVKCPGFHHYKTSPNVKTASVDYCHNFEGPHTANYTMSPKLLEYLDRRNNNMQ